MRHRTVGHDSTAVSLSPLGRRSTILRWLEEGDGIIPIVGEDKSAVTTQPSVKWYEDINGILQVAAANASIEEYRSGTYIGHPQEPQRQNTVEAYNVIGQDQDGSELITNGDNEAAVVTLTAADVTLAQSAAQAHSPTNSGLVTLTGGSAAHYVRSTTTRGKVYKISCWVYLPSGQTVDGIRLRDGTAVTLDSTTTTDSWVELSTTYVVSSTSFRIQAYDGSTGTVDADGDFFYIDDISLVEAGGTQLNSDGTDEGTFWSGGGEGAKNYRTGGAWINDAIPGMDGVDGTDDESYFEIVSDTAKIASATPDLSTAVTSGKTVKIVAGASAAMAIDFDGALTAADYAISAYVRGDSASDDDVKFRTDNVDGTAQDLTDEYALYDETITALNGDLSRIEIAAGDTIYITFFQAELGSAITSRIITQGSAVTRAVDDLQLPVADGTNFRQSEGMLFFEPTFGYNGADISANQGLVTQRDGNTTNVISKLINTAQLQIQDGSTGVSRAFGAGIVAGQAYKVYTSWSTTAMRAGVDGNSSSGSYDGAFTLGTHFRIGYGATERFWIKNIRILRVDRGQTYGESETA